MNTAETAEATNTFVIIGSPPLEPSRSGSRRQTVCLVAVAMGVEACLRVTDVEGGDFEFVLAVTCACRQNCRMRFAVTIECRDRYEDYRAEGVGPPRPTGTGCVHAMRPFDSITFTRT